MELEYIPVNDELLTLHSLANAKQMKLQQTHINSAIQAIAECLCCEFGENYTINDLAKNAKQPNKALVFSKNLNKRFTTKNLTKYFTWICETTLRS